MALNSILDKPVGVIGAGSFGTVIANLLAENTHVLLYARNEEVARQMQESRVHPVNGLALHQRVTATPDLQQVAESCQVLFPMVPGSNFRSMMRTLAPFLHPYHILIHGTKGLDVNLPEGTTPDTVPVLNRQQVSTMSEVITAESLVVRVGCLAGPNLAKELAQGQPAATVVASHFDEVIHAGQQLLRSPRFQVYGNSDLIGIELCGVLKNIIAIASGALAGLGYGDNARALLISRGTVEMIYLGRTLGGNAQAFLGLAGIGDLTATCLSASSRNYTVGNRLAQGQDLQDIINSMAEVAEGINTTRLVKKLATFYKVRAPITENIYKVLEQKITAKEALEQLMAYPFNIDVDFL